MQIMNLYSHKSRFNKLLDAVEDSEAPLVVRSSGTGARPMPDYGERRSRLSTIVRKVWWKGA